MYPGILPAYNFRRPSRLLGARNRLRKKYGLPIKIKHRPVIILTPMTTAMSWSCLDTNLRKALPLFSDPLHPQHELSKKLTKIIRDIGIENESYVVFLSHYLGPLAVDPVYENPTLAEEYHSIYVPHRVYGGIYISQAKKAYENDKKIYEWYSEHGFEAKQPLKKPEFDEKFEKKCAKKIREMLVGELTTFLYQLSEKDEVKVFPYITEGKNYSHDKKIFDLSIKNAVKNGANLKRYPTEGSITFVDQGDILSIYSKKSLSRLKQYIANQLGIRIKEKREETIEGQFFSYFPFEDPESRTITPFSYCEKIKVNGSEIKKYTFLFDLDKKTLLDFESEKITDKDRISEISKKYQIPKEKIPFVPPIEVVGLQIMERHSFIEPFKMKKEEGQKFDVEASDMNATCVIDILLSRAGLKTETERMRLGKATHELALGDPGTLNYINYEIYKLPIWNIEPVRRNEFCENTHYFDINGIKVKFTPDAAFIASDKIIPIDYKTSTPLRYSYEPNYANQLAVETIGFKSLGYNISDFAYLCYLEGPNIRDNGFWPHLRTVFLTKERLAEAESRIKNIYEKIDEIISHPSKLREEFYDMRKQGCIACSNIPENQLEKLENFLASL